MRYFINRLIFLIVSIWVAVTLNFILPRMMPGNPAEIMLAKFQGQMPPQAIHALMLQFGFSNKPMIIQYFQYLHSMLTGHWGLSFTYYPTPVTKIIETSLPWTLGLLGVAWVVAVVSGTVVGIWIAWHRGGRADSSIPIITTFFQSVPGFWLGIVLIYFFGFVHSWLPMNHAFGSDVTPGFNGPFILSIMYHAILPLIVIFLGSVSGWIVGMRNNMIMTLGEDYVVFAEAKGVSTKELIMGYAARNALLPQVTSMAIALSTIIGGQVLIEQIFSYPGIGFQLATAVSSEDYPLIQGMFLIIAVMTLVINFVVDMLYGRLDPRVRRRGQAA